MLELLSAFLSVLASAHEMLMLTFRVRTLIWKNINKIPTSHTQSSTYVRWSHSETLFLGDSILCQLNNQNCPIHLPINKGNILTMHKTRETEEKTASIITINYGINNCRCTYKDRQLFKWLILNLFCNETGQTKFICSYVISAIVTEWQEQNRHLIVENNAMTNRKPIFFHLTLSGKHGIQNVDNKQQIFDFLTLLFKNKKYVL